MAVLFRPSFPVDKTHWIPALRAALGDLDFRIWPECGDKGEIRYLVCWEPHPGDETQWPALRAMLSLKAGVDSFVASPYLPPGAALVRMVDPGLIRSMSEYVCAYVLRFHHRLDRFEREGPAAPWGIGSVPHAPDTARRRVGILGLGELGAASARALAPFGFSLAGWSRNRKILPGVESFVGADELDAFLKRSEILVCLLPLTPETEGILSARSFSLMPEGSYIINAARGAHLVEEDLIRALDSGRLAGAVLDVFRTEPLPPAHPFWSHPKIAVTPHISAITSPESGAKVLRESIAILESGGRPPGTVDLARGY